MRLIKQIGVKNNNRIRTVYNYDDEIGANWRRRGREYLVISSVAFRKASIVNLSGSRTFARVDRERSIDAYEADD